MLYKESPPSDRFAQLIKCFWSFEDDNAVTGIPEPIIPDGCVEIVFNLADRFRRHYISGKLETQPKSIVVGQMKQAVLIEPLGKVQLFGIRFQSAGAFSYFRFDLDELANRVEALETVFGNGLVEMEERIASASDFDERIAVTESLLKRSSGRPFTADERLSVAIDEIRKGRGQKRIKLIARDIGMSERNLERLFSRQIGLSPKQFSRTVRFQNVLRTFKTSSDRAFADAAYDFGYFDQSHLINDFQCFSGKSPAAFLDQTHRFTEMFLTRS